MDRELLIGRMAMTQYMTMLGNAKQAIEVHKQISKQLKELWIK